MNTRELFGVAFATLFALFAASGGDATAGLLLGPEEIVQSGGADLTVVGYSVPSLVDWNSDGRADLVVGEGGGLDPAKVCVFLNEGSAEAPAFSGFFYAQAGGVDLVQTSSGCLGLYPRVVYWDADSRKDLLVGTALGGVVIYLNTGSESVPSFDGGTPLQVGPIGFKVDIAVGSRATPNLVDWNQDGLRDLVVGAYDGKIHIFINSGLDTAPDYLAETYAQTSGGDLVVLGNRSSPVIGDFDDDQKKDILSGNTAGQLLLYSNIGSDAAPFFSGYTAIEADSIPIDLPGTPRSRPAVCDWTGDGWLDVLIGSADGRVRLYQGLEDLSGVGDIVAARIRLLGNHPNPFNPSTTIRFELPAAATVSLDIFDVSGRLVRRLERGVDLREGTHAVVWDGRDDAGHGLASGLYIYRLDAGGRGVSNAMSLVK